MRLVKKNGPHRNCGNLPREKLGETDDRVLVSNLSCTMRRKIENRLDLGRVVAMRIDSSTPSRQAWVGIYPNSPESLQEKIYLQAEIVGPVLRDAKFAFRVIKFEIDSQVIENDRGSGNVSPCSESEVQ